MVAKHNNWFEGGGASLFSRINTEEYARDSFENLLFSVCRFHELTDRWPKKITVIGYGFKKPRFANLHRSAIKFPLDSFNYIGIDPPGDLNDVIESETKNSVVPFTKDPYGCHSLLMQKKLGRNKWNRQNPYKETCAEISGLLNWCSHEDDAKLYPDSLPWSKSK